MIDDRLALQGLIEWKEASYDGGCVNEQRVEDAAVTAKWKGHRGATPLERTISGATWYLTISPLTTLIIDHPTHRLCRLTYKSR